MHQGGEGKSEGRHEVLSLSGLDEHERAPSGARFVWPRRAALSDMLVSGVGIEPTTI